MPQTLTLEDAHSFFKEIRELYQETDRRLKEQSQDTDRKIAKVTKAIGDLGGRLGDFVEEMVKPAAVRLFQEKGIDVHIVFRGVQASLNNESLELDLVVVNDTEMIAIECKSNLSVDDVDDHLERLSRIKRVMPRYKNMNIMGAVAGMVIPDNVAAYAYRKGLYVLSQSGENIIIRNDDKFKPRFFSNVLK